MATIWAMLALRRIAASCSRMPLANSEPVIMPDSGQVQKVFGSQVAELAEDEQFVFDARGMAVLTVITGTGATATVSRVDDDEAEEHTTGTENAFTVAAETRTVTQVDWPFYLVSVADGSCRVALA